MRTRELSNNSASPTAQMINNMLARHQEHTQQEIAIGAGFPEASARIILTQIKNGRTKLPYSAILPLCEFLKEDPKPLIAVAAMEYAHEVFEIMEESGIDIASIKNEADSAHLRTIKDRQELERSKKRVRKVKAG